MPGDVREEFEMKFARQFGSEFVAEPKQFWTHHRIEFFHSRAEAFNFENLEVGLPESQRRHDLALRFPDALRACESHVEAETLPMFCQGRLLC
jgi:hypothetical protein